MGDSKDSPEDHNADRRAANKNQSQQFSDGNKDYYVLD